MRGTAKCYDELRSYCETVPLVDCHDHTGHSIPTHPGPIAALKSGYLNNDISSASSEETLAILDDTSLSLEERWPIFEKVWKRTCHTGYAQVTKRVLKRFYGEEELTLDALQRMQDKLVDPSNEEFIEEVLEEANIAIRIDNLLEPDVKAILEGTAKMPPRARPVIGLPAYHAFTSYESGFNVVGVHTIQSNTAPLGRHVTCLGEYLEACREIFEGYKRFGAVAFKDQSAYTRPIDYGNPTRAQAEEVFNWMSEDPRRRAAYPDGTRPLDDYLFHEFMRMARDMDLPVQVHTGYVTGMRNDVAKANAVKLTKVLELHRDVQFDLFHANWPYSGEFLYLGKNYPNVALDFCWAHVHDPIFCQSMLKQTLSCVPHGKIHIYGSDYVGSIERAWANAQITRENVAIALSDLVEMEYLDLDEAKEVAHAWLFGNANEFFRLGL